MATETSNPIVVLETPLRDSTDWIKVRREVGQSEFEWRTSDGSIQYVCEASPRDGVALPQAELSLDKAPHRSSMVHDGTRITRTSPTPPKVLCVIVVFLRDELHVCRIPLHLDDRDEQMFESEIMQRVESYVQAQGPKDRRTYIRAGRVRLLALTEDQLREEATTSVENPREWDRHVTKMIAKYCSKDDDSETLTPFMLEVRLEYEWLTIDKTKRTLYDGIRKVLIDHRMTNMHGEEFWSKRLLKALFIRSTVNQLLTEDISWKQEAAEAHIGEHRINDEQEAFLDFIMLDRTRLLAAMVRAKVAIACLYTLWKSGYKHHDNIALDRDILGDKLDHFDATDLCNHMASFNPVTFPRPFDKREPLRHKRIGTGQVVPVLYDESDGKDKVEIGRGSFGTVYRVKVQGDYHGFSADKDECYALKCLNRKLESTAEVDGEARVLEMLALRPHDHITPLYASWTREGMTYILLPKADMSLQQFLRHQDRPDLTNQDKVIWLFTQLQGLAAAVSHIHHIGFNQASSTSAAAMEARKKKLHMGYHHDLKPGNVLLFGTNLKVSDFGAAKIHQLVSGEPTANTPYTNTSPYGDETYGGPDRLVDPSAKVGQPYDIWSLGCIYLEILLWATGYGNKLEDFARERMRKQSKCLKCPSPQPHGGANAMNSNKTKTEISTSEDEDDIPMNEMETHSYWYQCEKGKCHLKPCVEQWLRRVKVSHCMKNELLHRLYQEIRKMLKIKPADRVSAGVVRDNINNLRYQAEVNFTRRDFEDFGCEMHIGDIESDNTTCVDSASNYIPVPETQRSRSNTLELPSAHRSPSGRLSGDEAILRTGSNFDPDQRALESGTDIGTNTPGPSASRRNSANSTHSGHPSLFVTEPDGELKAIDRIDNATRFRTRRHRSESSIRLAVGTHETNILHNSSRSTQLELSQQVSEVERMIRDTPQQEIESPQRSEAGEQPNAKDDQTQAGIDLDRAVPLPVRQDSVSSVELYWKLCGEVIRQHRMADTIEVESPIGLGVHM